MKKHAKKMIYWILIVVVAAIIGGNNVLNAAPVYSGSCGSSVNWTVTDKQLIISGSGMMSDYKDPSEVPWNPYAEEIQSISIQSTITHISSCAFSQLCCLNSTVDIPKSVKTLGYASFDNVEVKIRFDCGQFSNSDIEFAKIPLKQIVLNEGSHDLDEGIIKVYPTVNEWGVIEYTCKRGCGYKLIEAIEPLTLDGTCGANATWKLYLDERTLVISGSGLVEENSKIKQQYYLIDHIHFTGGPYTLGEECFSSLSGLATVSCDTNTVITSVGKNAFKNDTGLNSFPFQNALRQIDEGAFANCVSLLELDLSSSGIMSIGHSAFAGCCNLYSLILPNCLETVGDFAFKNTAITTLTIPQKVDTIGKGIFYGCNSLVEILSDSSQYSSINKQILINSEGAIIAGCKSAIIPTDTAIKAIDAYAFAGIQFDCFANKESLNIPSNIVKLGEGCFENVQGSVRFLCNQFADETVNSAKIAQPEYQHLWDGGTVTKQPTENSEGNIVYCCKSNAAHTKNEMIGPTPYSGIEGNLFWYIDASGVLTVRSKTADITADLTAKEAKFWCDYSNKIKTIRIGFGIENIAENTFTDYSMLNTIVLSDYATNIEPGAFRSLTKLNAIIVDTNNPNYDGTVDHCCLIRKKDQALLLGCASEDSYKQYNKYLCSIPDGVRIIESFAFDRQYYLSAVSIPASMEQIRVDAFVGNTNLSAITIADNPYYVSEGDNIIRKADAALLLGKGKIPSGIRKIEKYAFTYSNISSICIPDSVSEIDPYAFAYCISLEEIIVDSGNETFKATESNTGITNSKEAGKLIIGTNRISVHEFIEIGDYALTGRTTIDSVYFNNKLKYIGIDAFKDCSGIVEIIIPNTYIYTNSSFEGLTKLQSVYLEDGEDETPDFSLSTCKFTPWQANADHSVHVTVDYGVENLGDYMFIKMSQGWVEISDDVVDLGNNTFINSKVTLAMNCYCRNVFSDQQIEECGINKNNIVLIHRYDGDYVVDSEPTCTTDGSKSLHCSDCGTINTSSTQTIKALGHKTAFTEAKAATCTTSGNYAYYYCSRCKKYFSDSDCKHEIKQSEIVIAAKGHNIELVLKVDATCTTDGCAEHYHCKNCDKCFSDAAGENEVTLQSLLILKNGHAANIVHNAKVNPSCETAGSVENYYCSQCQKYYSDEQCSLIISDITIAPLGHDYSENFTVDDEPDCTTTGSKSHHCSRCSSKADVTVIAPLGHDVQTNEKVDPGCEKDGCQQYYECSRCNRTYSDSACQHEVMDLTTLIIPKTGHDYGNYVSNNDATLDHDGTKSAVCSHCGSTKTITDAETKLTLTNITMSAMPNKVYYHLLTEELDLTGSKMVVTYSGGNSEELNVVKGMTSGFDNTKVGENTITVKYYGQSTNFTVHITQNSRADYNGDAKVTDRDALYLLYHVYFPTRYPLSQDGDINKDGKVTDRDALYLLYHVYFPSSYPIDD